MCHKKRIGSVHLYTALFHSVSSGNPSPFTVVCIHNILKANLYHIHPHFQYDTGNHAWKRCSTWCFILLIQTKYMGMFKWEERVYIVNGLRLLPVYVEDVLEIMQISNSFVKYICSRADLNLVYSLTSSLPLRIGILQYTKSRTFYTSNQLSYLTY